MKTFTNQLDLIAFWEGFRPYTYPDPVSDLYKSYPKAPWGFKSIDEILKDQPSIYKQLDGEPFSIGYGQAHNLPDGTPITPDMTCTKEQARVWLTYKFSYNEKALSNFIGADIFESLDSNADSEGYPKIEALSDYAYNCGLNAFPKLIAKLKANDIPGASLEFLDGFYVNSKPILGLLLRRISEYHTFTTGEYVAWEKGDPISQDLMDKLVFMNAHNPDAINMIDGLRIK